MREVVVRAPSVTQGVFDTLHTRGKGVNSNGLNFRAQIFHVTENV